MKKEILSIVEKINSVEKDIKLIDEGNLTKFKNLDSTALKSMLKKEVINFCNETINNLQMQIFSFGATEDSYDYFKELTNMFPMVTDIKKKDSSSKKRPPKKFRIRTFYSNLEISIVNFLTKNGAITDGKSKPKMIPLRVISESLNVSQSEVEKTIKDLKNRGFIYSSSRRGGGYAIQNLWES